MTMATYQVERVVPTLNGCVKEWTKVFIADGLYEMPYDSVPYECVPYAYVPS